MKTVTVLGGSDCGGKVIVRDVEAVSPREVVVRRVLTADVDAGLGHVTCERSWFSQMAKQQSSWRSSTGENGPLIPQFGSEFDVVGGVEQNDGNGSGTSRSGL